jgi:5-formyltetrahydrofolate cyclo-ligase
VLLVPLLAFDAEGYRLGYGGGFYDRTLAALQARAIGIAFAGQRVDFLPRDAHDYSLDAVLTEQGLTRFR